MSLLAQGQLTMNMAYIATNYLHNKTNINSEARDIPLLTVGSPSSNSGPTDPDPPSSDNGPMDPDPPSSDNGPMSHGPRPTLL